MNPNFCRAVYLYLNSPFARWDFYHLPSNEQKYDARYKSFWVYWLRLISISWVMLIVFSNIRRLSEKKPLFSNIRELFSRTKPTRFFTIFVPLMIRFGARNLFRFISILRCTHIASPRVVLLLLLLLLLRGPNAYDDEVEWIYSRSPKRLDCLSAAGTDEPC